MKKSEILRLVNLSVEVAGKELLHSINLTIRSGEIHAVMGPNGSGKSTLVYAIMGHPEYQVKSHTSDTTRSKKPSVICKILLNKIDITRFTSEDRAKKGIFLALQSPIAIPGVTVTQIIRTALSERYIGNQQNNNRRATIQNPLLSIPRMIGDMTMPEFIKNVQKYAANLGIAPELLKRGIHDGFSGGERKKLEMLQAIMLAPKLAMFDEIDTGLDVDALRTVAGGIQELKKQGVAVLIVTHYQRILRYLVPDAVHVLSRGCIVATGDRFLAQTIEKKGYASYATL